METFQNINVNLIDKPLYIFLMGSCLKIKKKKISSKHNILLPAFVWYRFRLYRMRFYVLVFHVCRMTLDAFEGLQFTHLLGTIYSLFGPFCYWCIFAWFRYLFQFLCNNTFKSYTTFYFVGTYSILQVSD